MEFLKCAIVSGFADLVTYTSYYSLYGPVSPPTQIGVFHTYSHTHLSVGCVAVSLSTQSVVITLMVHGATPTVLIFRLL